VTLFGGAALRPLAGFDLVTLALGLLLGWAAWWVGRKGKRQAAAKTSAANVSAVAPASREAA
jgi:hypothetical protein